MMLVASDDPRVVGEYGKTLAEKGRAQDAVQFLTRATELQPNDWTLYSALGVSYDQIGDQASARMAYEHALALKPERAQRAEQLCPVAHAGQRSRHGAPVDRPRPGRGRRLRSQDRPQYRAGEQIGARNPMRLRQNRRRQRLNKPLSAHQ